MAYRNGNYAAFYVSEPFSMSNLGASATKDFVFYNLLRSWKGADNTFPFIDSHDKNYNVRDSSDWEKTLKPRIHDRLNNSKNIILFLSSVTKDSRALHEEIDFGINSNELPIIVIYPEYKEKCDIINSNTNNFKPQITNLWDNLPIFRNSMKNVPTLHIPFKKEIIQDALNNTGFMINSRCSAKSYFYKL